jgi:hypothetical protein
MDFKSVAKLVTEGLMRHMNEYNGFLQIMRSIASLCSSVCIAQTAPSLLSALHAL